ncbi:alpha/beta fold hydrolase [Polaromonas sp. SM01]|uniref:alpha/beta fold hydrolase n=1 Tax=Polaromonas sp. SM01 TaxID=3085630 RepID=UPI0029828E7D|nr:alpha/beta fold hydrolase [Polaromonas sp. SM01]MDW5440961.1 alpha/beta fold hydrolase [Polaromonas sp. SM01]
MRPEQISAKGTANGTAYSVYGAGEPLVLIHGVGMAQDAWTPQISELARDHRVIVYDMLGHGASRIPDEGVTLADYAAQLAGLLDHLGLPAANVVGHSMGALVALEFALTYPARTLRVAALNAVFMRTPEQQAAVLARAATLQDIGVQATVDSTIARWFGDPVPTALQDSARLVSGILARVHPQGYARTYRLFASCDRVHADRLATLAMPALFMTGEFDPNSSPSMSDAMAQRAPLATLDIVPGARHMMNMTDPQRINQGLQKFLAQPLAMPGTQRLTAPQIAA